MPDWFSWGTRYERTCRPTRSPGPLGPSAPAGITKEEMLALLKENNEVSKSELKLMLDDSIAVLKVDIKNLRREIRKAPFIQVALQPLGAPTLVPVVRILPRRGARRGAVRGRRCGLDGPRTS
ncbi:hypothetical protein C348_01472 [Cryptococcus neoformans Gb118]|nr:hypothetical protein C350_00868 [Cryptococcus neoformans var. grubii MW-RSA36]OXL10565.1 hypothetical protein C348_01472 [Cryptococcus neoformans var. grubii Gb118]